MQTLKDGFMRGGKFAPTIEVRRALHAIADQAPDARGVDRIAVEHGTAGTVARSLIVDAARRFYPTEYAGLHSSDRVLAARGVPEIAGLAHILATRLDTPGG